MFSYSHSALFDVVVNVLYWLLTGKDNSQQVDKIPTSHQPAQAGYTYALGTNTGT